MQLLVLATEPKPDVAKPGLCPPCEPVQAAAIARASLADTLDVVRATPAARRVLVLDGEPDRWLPSGIEVVPQATGSLGDRLAAAFALAFRHGPGPVVLVGMDTPQVTPAQLAEAGTALAAASATASTTSRPPAHALVGPAIDGGWWLLGLSHPDPAAVDGLARSAGAADIDQLAHRRDVSYQVRLTDELRDVDRFEDAAAIAAEIPGGRFRTAVEIVSRSLGPTATAGQ